MIIFFSVDIVLFNLETFVIDLQHVIVFKSRSDMTKCELNQIFLGEVVSVQNYGAFIRIPGISQQGLIHRTQVILV